MSSIGRRGKGSKAQNNCFTFMSAKLFPINRLGNEQGRNFCVPAQNCSERSIRNQVSERQMSKSVFGRVS